MHTSRERERVEAGIGDRLIRTTTADQMTPRETFSEVPGGESSAISSHVYFQSYFQSAPVCLSVGVCRCANIITVFRVRRLTWCQHEE